MTSDVQWYTGFIEFTIWLILVVMTIVYYEIIILVSRLSLVNGDNQTNSTQYNTYYIHIRRVQILN